MAGLKGKDEFNGEEAQAAWQRGFDCYGEAPVVGTDAYGGQADRRRLATLLQSEPEALHAAIIDGFACAIETS